MSTRHKTKRITVGIILLVMLFSLQGCFWSTISRKDGEIIIRGHNTISGETFTIEPGTTVKFTHTTFLAMDLQDGGLTLTNGAKLIAQGTKDKPIIFELVDPSCGSIVFEETSNGNESIIEYCKFDGVEIACRSSATIKYSKFISHGGITCKGEVVPIIEFNDFRSGIGLYGSSPVIRYNNINGAGNGIICSDRVDLIYGVDCIPEISFNNITNCEYRAVDTEGDVTVTISNNYISDCNGKTGVDTTSEQSADGVTYQNPRTTPVENAGCGW